MTANITDAEAGRALRVVLATWQDEEEFLREPAFPVTVVRAPSDRDEDVAPLLRDADALVTIPFTKAMAAGANRLRLIQVGAAGTNLVDLAAVPAAATVCNIYGHEGSIAEYVFATMVSLSRDLPGLDRRLRQGEWFDHAAYQTQIRGRTIGLIGFGHIGAEIARTARCFDMRVLAVTRRPEPRRAAELGITFLGGMEAMGRVLAEADFVVVAVPLLAETQGLLGAAEMRQMKSTAYLINVARGEVIEETAFYEALRDRVIAGAAIDVWYQYPGGWPHPERGRPSTLPFHELPNVIMTPHISGWTIDTFRYRWRAVAENLRRLAAGEPLLNVVYSA